MPAGDRLRRPVMLLAFSTAIWQMLILRYFNGVFGGFYVLVHALAAQTTPRDRQSASFSLFASIAVAASSGGPVSLSTLASSAGLRSPLIVAAIGFACCFVPLAVAGRRSARWVAS